MSHRVPHSYSRSRPSRAIRHPDPGRRPLVLIWPIFTLSVLALICSVSRCPTLCRWHRWTCYQKRTGLCLWRLWRLWTGALFGYVYYYEPVLATQTLRVTGIYGEGGPGGHRVADVLRCASSSFGYISRSCRCHTCRQCNCRLIGCERTLILTLLMYSVCLRCPRRPTDICPVSPLFRHRAHRLHRLRFSAGRGDWVVSQNHRESSYVAVYYKPCSELAPFIRAVDSALGCGASPHRPGPAARTDTDLPWFHSTAGAGSPGRPTTGSLVTGGAI